MPASHGLQNTAFVCGMENEANCLRAAGIDDKIEGYGRLLREF